MAAIPARNTCAVACAPGHAQGARTGAFPASSWLVELIRIIVDPANESLDAPAGGAGLRVVLIDDNVDSVDALSMLLELEGHAVQVACDGAAGLALIESVGPDVVLCDIGLPGLDGFEAARAARRMVRVPLLVAISGYAQPGDAARLPN